MSRLLSHIARIEAQRDTIDMLATAIDGLPGPVVELGLGNGRTYDHLRQRLPDREIYVFERKVAAHPNCIPPDERLILGDMEETLESPRRHLPQPAAMIHSDIGTGDADRNARFAKWLAPRLVEMLAPHGYLASDQTLEHPHLKPQTLPRGVRPGRYHIFRYEPADDNEAMATESRPAETVS